MLLAVFVIAFWWAGGGNLAQPFLPKPVALPAIGGTWERVHRVFALKDAVQAKVDKQNYTRLKDIPLIMQQSIIAVEDNRFYSHSGFDIEGILRATLVNLQTGALQEGGSTITQQLVKNLFLTQERTWGRKAEEVVLAVDMELRYSKEEILELYLNTIYFGSGANGITNAAKVYFGKTPASLTLPESAMLAGLPNAPSAFSPYVDLAAAKQRQAVVLAAMVRYGYIGPGLAQAAKDESLHMAR
ncbi:MAG: transglycosylase domain-containing protein [Negativicutes bacterium]|nr:transglycosylase domain-containing protein [Negativicutes bacterium]